MQQRNQELRELELAEVTGRPVITTLAQTLSRTLTDMYDWDRDRKQKVFELKSRLVREKRDLETLELSRGGRFVGPGSLRYLSKKENLEKQVENRLLNFGQLVEAKK